MTALLFVAFFAQAQANTYGELTCGDIAPDGHMECACPAVIKGKKYTVLLSIVPWSSGKITVPKPTPTPRIFYGNLIPTPTPRAAVSWPDACYRDGEPYKCDEPPPILAGWHKYRSVWEGKMRDYLVSTGGIVARRPE